MRDRERGKRRTWRGRQGPRRLWGGLWLEFSNQRESLEGFRQENDVSDFYFKTSFWSLWGTQTVAVKGRARRPGRRQLQWSR